MIACRYADNSSATSPCLFKLNQFGQSLKKEDIAFCGLNCQRCRENFAEIRQKIKSLDESFEKVNMQEIAKAIPFMRSKYKGYKKLTAFFSQECPGRREKGGNPFCGIRKCATKKSFFTCAECESLCKKFNTLYKIHVDNVIQTNIEQIRAKGIDAFVDGQQ